MKAKISAALVAALLSSAALADPTGTSYAGFQIAKMNYDESGFDEFEPTAIVGRFGHHFSQIFSLEGRVGFGVSDDSKTYSYYGVPVALDFEIDNLIGIYGAAHVPVGNAFSIYGLAGYTRGEITVTATASDGFDTFSESVSDDDTSFSFGVGAELNVSPSAAFTVEYMSYLYDTDYELTALSAGLNVKF